MFMPRQFIRPVCALVVLSMTCLALPANRVHAAMIGTPAVLLEQQTRIDREQLFAALERADVQEKLTALGVDPAQARERVAALTPQELEALNARMAEMPAGGDLVGAIVLIFLVLLLTDLLGLTDVFPFVKKGRR